MTRCNWMVMAFVLAGCAANPPGPHSLIIFVADGLRSGSVTHALAPRMNDIKAQGVFFANSHSIFPTFTMPNASAIATGHFLGDGGTFSNVIHTGYPEVFANGSVTPFIENDQVLGDIDTHFAGTITDQNGTVLNTGFLDEETVIAAARAAGLSTAAVGKLGPAALQDHQNSRLLDPAHRDARGADTIIVDDRTGSAAGIPLAPDFAAALTASGLRTVAPGRGANGVPGNNTTPGTTVPNRVQQDYFVDVTTKVILPRFAAAGKAFAMVFWSRDPDGTQHNQGDSLNRITPGINGPTARAGVTNADSDLARLMAALDRLGLSATTDLIVIADHGFSTISKNSGPGNSSSRTSSAAARSYRAYRAGALTREVQTGYLPPGFVAIDIAQHLGKPLFDPDSAASGLPKPISPASYPPVDPVRPPARDGSRLQRPALGNGLIGVDPAHPDVVVAANGGSDLIYLPNPANAAQLAPQVVEMLMGEDYVSGVFVDDRLGPIPGTLPLSAINLQGKAITPVPTIVVNFASFSTVGQGCPDAAQTQCVVEIADTPLQQGQGMHGSFSRGDTFNFMAAIGPDFRSGFTDPAPVSNADIGRTAAALLKLRISAQGALTGRVIGEALRGGSMPAYRHWVVASAPDASGRRTVLARQSVGDVSYFDAAGFAGKTVGLDQNTGSLAQ